MALGEVLGKRRLSSAVTGWFYSLSTPLFSLSSLRPRYTSMGGLLVADALIEFVRTRPDPSAPLWPNIVACIAFDTPVSCILPRRHPFCSPLFIIF